jgi:hypothetical protein
MASDNETDVKICSFLHFHCWMLANGWLLSSKTSTHYHAGLTGGHIHAPYMFSVWPFYLPDITPGDVIQHQSIFHSDVKNSVILYNDSHLLCFTK